MSVVRVVSFALMVLIAGVATFAAPRVALAEIDPGSYTDGFMSEHGIGQQSSDELLSDNGFKTYQGGEVLPGFGNIGATMTALMLGFVPVLFIIKFAGRAMLNITGSGDSKGNLDIPNFFKTADERSANPNGGGAKAGTSWYVSMAKDFLRYFGVAVAVWLIFAAIIGIINVIMGLNSASTEPSDVIGQFGK